ncbi:uncharacterized protein LOC109596895 isoform X2 [Aethina tumida]|uniref:uncharacterized protein LOC109596895 isoform X2 n=1 Tax=Aethina tumida TaxID=116153 RepID=UPI002147F7D4|nr:uncharacterized protein LOC109596895 isoform X2 [Aethina tumida]
MDFDLSKENIQPLRGGRNPQQLGMALQAQTNRETQLELERQREEFETAIRTYEGVDPLDNWYHYISWVEQSYPKHGHEGNLVNLLEHCLARFESDPRYLDDRRFCKLWIKYIDMHSEPIELFHMMYANGLCRGCADLYKAWSHYHEAAEDFQGANNILELGKKAMAQPYEELEMAYQNLLMAVGQYNLHGPDVARRSIVEKRQVLTSLHTYRPGRVASVRTASGGPGAVGFGHAASAPHSRTNAPIAVFEDNRTGAGMTAGPDDVGPQSIITAARRQNAVKENALRPGAWTGATKKRPTVMKNNLGFTVHEDGTDSPETSSGGSNNSFNHSLPRECLEDYSKWRPSIRLAEPADPRMIPMYPKDRVYIDPNTEYSIEELRSIRYNSRRKYHRRSQAADVNADGAASNHSQQMQQTMPSLMLQQTLVPRPDSFYQTMTFPPHADKTEATQLQDDNRTQHPVVILDSPEASPQHPSAMGACAPVTNNSWCIGQPPQTPQLQDMSSPKLEPMASNSWRIGQSPQIQLSDTTQFEGLPNNTLRVGQASQTQQSKLELLWNNSSTSDSSTASLSAPAPKSKVVVYEQSMTEVPAHTIQPKGTAMKTPFKALTADELAETGSRGGMDVAETAKAADGAHSRRSVAPSPVVPPVNAALFNDDSSSSYENPIQDLNATCNTQLFNLNCMHVSTPETKRQQEQGVTTDEEVGSTRKQLFAEPYQVRRSEAKALSVIYEDSKSGFGSSTSSGGSTKSSNQTTASTMRGSTMATIEEHNSYLAQNLMANAALRSSLLGNLMTDYGTPPPVDHRQDVSSVNTVLGDSYTQSPRPSSLSVPNETLERTIPKPASVTPLSVAPANPFDSELINQLLERVRFPGPHTQGYKRVSMLPKLAPKKDPVFIDNTEYIVEKMIGKGTYGTVFKALNKRYREYVAIKYQKPPNPWEFYICREIQSRLNSNELRAHFMDVSQAYYMADSSILISEFMPYGSLLDVANLVKQKSGKGMKEILCFYFTLEMLSVVQTLHDIQIIHADIKPDNFLVMLKPDGTAGLQLIDFGCSIDMTLFPAGTTFTQKITTEDFVCCEMRDGRPWSYHTDLFCVAASAHVLLFEKYISSFLSKAGNVWSINSRFPRYARVDLWNTLFSALLNQQEGPADTAPLMFMLREHIDNTGSFSDDMRFLVNMLKGR